MAKAGRPKKIQPTAEVVAENATSETNEIVVKESNYISITKNLAYFPIGKGMWLRYESENGSDIVYIPDDIPPTGNFTNLIGASTSVLSVGSGSVVKEETKKGVSLKHVAQSI